MSLIAEPISPEDPEPVEAPLLRGYQPLLGHVDEWFAPSGALRPALEPVARMVSGLGAEGLAEREEAARLLLRDNGVTYNVYGDPRNAARAMELDLLPLVLDEAEWSAIESGLTQRARLMNALLSDLYGAQATLKNGLVHPAIVQTNPDFLRPMVGMKPPGGLWLHTFAVDLARSADGAWRVIGDRSRTPAGAGYALENRVVASRALPDLYRALRVRRVAAWFDRLRQSLRVLAPRTRSPRIVLMTPGPYNETFFEHAYLARYLGFTLVEGSDLTVRRDQVFLKTLGGLEPVDVILRRVDDDFCDPLELRGDSTLGVAGLVQAARAGNVVIANALGAGLIETPALMPALPALARHLLDETLELPQLETYWAGTADHRERLAERCDALATRFAFPLAGRSAPAGRAAWTAHLRRHPYDAVGQDPLALSTVPTFEGDRIVAQPVVMRCFVAATNDGYSVMPGGFVRVAPDPDRAMVRLQQSGLAKDALILSSGPVDEFSLLRPPDSQVEVRRQGNNLPSRVADDLYWVGRYAERAEFAIRTLRALVLRLTDGAGTGAQNEIGPCAHFLQVLGELTPALAEAAVNARATFDHELVPFLTDDGRTNGVYATLRRLSGNASMVRDRLSLDMARTLRFVDAHVEDLREVDPGDHAGLLSLFDSLVMASAAMAGLGMENMTRGQAWRFMDLGRRIERALASVNLLRVLVVGGPDHSGQALDLALDIADSFMTYRARYFTYAQFAPVFDLLLLDEANPRSLAFQIRAIADHVENLPRERGAGASGSARLLIQTALAELRGADVTRLAGTNRRGRHTELEALLEAIAETLPELSDLISQTYFSHALAVRPDGPTRGPMVPKVRT